jgi:hypothetical protein
VRGEAEARPLARARPGRGSAGGAGRSARGSCRRRGAQGGSGFQARVSGREKRERRGREIGEREGEVQAAAAAA